MAKLSGGVLLHGVDETSAAYAAGLRDGQMLVAWSFWYGDPDREVVLTVRRPDAAGAPLRIRYLPRGRQVTIPQAELVTGCVDASAGDRERAAAKP